MTARPVDPESRRRPVYAAVALVLVLVAVLLAAGCVSQGLGNQTHSLPKEKYVYLHHDRYSNIVSDCGWLSSDQYFPDSFDKNTEVLSLGSDIHDNESINDSLILFYNSESRRSYNEGRHSFNSSLDAYLGKERVLYGSGEGVYSLPREVSENVTLESVAGDGTVSLRYDDKQIVLEPKASWENNTNKPYFDYEINFAENGSPYDRKCSGKIYTTNRIYNAGVFDKKKIEIVNRRL
jgi:hypothetical protein